MTNSHNVFGGAYIDRASEYRADSRWLAQALTGNKARIVLLNAGRCLASRDEGHLRLLKSVDLPFSLRLPDLIFMGLIEHAPVFARETSTSDYEPRDGDEFIDLRSLGGFLNPTEANLAAHAIGMAHWRSAQRFCSQCGHATQIEAAGYASRCQNNDCNGRIFPRVDPAIIVLVERGDYCLLGRQGSWPKGLFSTIAGFVEPGESLEDAVAREVFEETNVQVEAVRYQSSQPWPFPASLMLGFHASAVSEDIVTNDGELEEARWFHRDELIDGTSRLPPGQSIARRLIEHWLQDSDET